MKINVPLEEENELKFKEEIKEDNIVVNKEDKYKEKD